MPKEKQEPKAEEKTEEKAQAEPIEFLQKAGKLGYPIADVFGIVKVISREDDNLSLGFQDMNGRKEIVLTSTKEVWKKLFEDGLAYLENKA